LLLVAPAFALGQAQQSTLKNALGEPQPAQEVTEVVTAPRTPSVAALFETRNDIQAFLLSIDRQQTNRLTPAQKQELSLLNKDLQEIRRVFETEGDDSLSFEALIDKQTRVRTELRRVESLAAQLATRADLQDGQQ
jgi:hypothetical protein